VSLKEDPLFHITMPSKIQAIMACAQPLIVSAPGDAGVLGELSGAGWSVPAGDPAALAHAMLHASRVGPEELADRGRRGRAYYNAHLSSEVGVAKLAAALEAARLSGLRHVG
jgi:hypothetical protein